MAIEVTSSLRSAYINQFVYASQTALFVRGPLSESSPSTLPSLQDPQIYDYLLTLGDEVEFVWPSGFSLAEILFYALRYSAWPETCVELLFYFGLLDEGQCKAVGIYLCFSLSIGMTLGQSIIVLRTWVIWNGQRAVKVCFAVVCVACTATCMYLSVQWVTHTQFAPGRLLAPNMTGCIMISPYRLVHVGWAIFCCIDLALIVLTGIKYKQDVCPGASQLTVFLYREALTYFSMMLTLAVANLLMFLLAAEHYQVVLSGMERMLYTSLSCRIVLHLRAVARAPLTSADSVLTMTDLRAVFHRRDVASGSV